MQLIKQNNCRLNWNIFLSPNYPLLPPPPPPHYLRFKPGQQSQVVGGKCIAMATATNSNFSEWVHASQFHFSTQTLVIQFGV